MGFDPMMQFIHEDDVAEAMALALEHGHARGVQRGRPRRGAAVGRHPRDRRHRHPPPRHAGARPVHPALPIWASTTCRPAPSTSSSIPARSTAAGSAPPPASSHAARSRTSSPVSVTDALRRTAAEVIASASQLLVEPVAELEREIEGRLQRIPTHLNRYGYDAFGMNPAAAKRALLATALMYRYWFRVETHGVGAPAGRPGAPDLEPRGSGRDRRHHDRHRAGARSRAAAHHPRAWASTGCPRCRG